jgi:ABC-type nickel/cobalt efflux system permease component RcnA
VSSGRKAWRACVAVGLALAALPTSAAWPHDIPNERVDRSIQISVKPPQLFIDYEVSLSELTLTQNLRALIGGLPGGDRAQWLAQYAQVTGPLNAKGILVAIDGQPALLEERGCDIAVEEHPRYTFHFTVSIPAWATVRLSDTNYVSSEGTSRLAVRAVGDVALTSDDLPAEVNDIPIRPVWQLSDAEERRTKQVEFRYRATGSSPAPAPWRNDRLGRSVADAHGVSIAITGDSPGLDRISRLLGEGARIPRFLLATLAVLLGAAHALQPGHGKTLVTAVALEPDVRFYQPALLGLATTTAHAGSVLGIAAALWFSGATRIEALHSGLAQGAGVAIAAAGFWRLGHVLGGHPSQSHDWSSTSMSGNLAILGAGLAGGIVPCWDAVALLLGAAALGRLGEGIGLVLAFSAGMAATLVLVGGLAWKARGALLGKDTPARWQRALALGSSALLAVVGTLLFLR